MKKMSDRMLITAVILAVVTFFGGLAAIVWLTRPTQEKFDACRNYCAKMDAPSWQYGSHGCLCGGPTN